MNFLMDSNTLIEAKNRYYRMDVCPGYWDWLLKSHGVGTLASIQPVRDELTRGNDELADWAKQNAAVFSSITDNETQAAFSAVANFVAQQPGMKAGAVQEFLSGADPWLVAKALTTGASVVTHERHNPAVRVRFLIPNVCQQFGVKHMDTFDLLSGMKARFILA